MKNNKFIKFENSKLTNKYKMNVKDIDLCGLGNGLVDLLYEVSFEELEQLGLRKGEMRLVDDTLQKKLLEKLAGRSYTICSGGSAANTIIAFSQFGGTSAYHTVVGDDDFGRFYVNEFNELGISINAPMINEPTGTCIVLITPDSERTMNTSLGATAHFGVEHITPDYIRRAKWVYLEGYKFTAEKSTEALFFAIELAKKHEAKISLSLSDVFVITNFFDKVLEAIKHIDLLFCNEIEALTLTETSNIDQAKRKLTSLVPNFVITLGAKGSIANINKSEYQFPAYSTKAIDTTGAGDMFAGAFLFGLIQKGDINFAGHLASLSSSRIVSQFGARLKDNHKEIINQLEKQLL
ncbi:adenosine kinase [Bacteroidetes/Chlorobi group bacterium Naka2016]|nr:MAG: adenosine kinase [Bacteroidetes/Chlorobi group bacterium Naka2016]